MANIHEAAKILRDEYKTNMQFRQAMILSAKSAIDECFSDELNLKQPFDCMILAERAMDRVMGYE